jgi:aspartyl-tRNA(Asn)/glutamyl-tRNA(Gln) amidotransferase subunit C
VPGLNHNPEVLLCSQNTNVTVAIMVATPRDAAHQRLATPGRSSLSLSREQVQHIARLARVGLSDDDITNFSDQLSEILDYFERLSQVDTQGVPPTAHTLSLHNVWRDVDEPEPPLDKEDVLANAPVRDGDYFRVKVILEE